MHDLICYLKEPTERVLGRFTEDRNGQSHEVTECFYEISLNDSIQQLFTSDTALL